MAMRSDLSDRMDFDHVIEVTEDGDIIDRPDIYAPNLYDGEVDDDAWTLLDGYSGQYRYSGPIMHNSEFIGGAMARDILDTPGVYVALVCYWPEEDADDEDIEDNIEGWAVATLRGGGE